MKKLFFLLLIPLLSLASLQVNAQCAASGSVTTTTTTTANTCSGNGTITASFSSALNTTIQLIKGGAILQSVVNPASPYTFTTLQPGTDYEVKAVCSIDNSIVYSTNTNITVANNYVPITNAAISVTNVCTSFTPGGTITVNGVTGGTAPYQYSIILNNSPGYDDTLSSYSTPASAPPYTKTVTAFGTYQIRIKDACGSFSTFTRTIAPSVDPVRFYWRSKEICGSTQVEGSLWYLANGLTNGNATESDYLPAPGIKLKIQADNAAGAVLFDGFYTGSYFNYTPSASHMYYVTATNACGASVSYTHDLLNPNGNPEFLNFAPSTSTTGCGASEKETLSINFGDQYYWRFPLTIVVKNSLGVIVNPGAPVFNGNIWTLGGLPVDTYTITVSDSCSPANSLTKTINSPVAAGAPVLSLYQKTKWRCEGGVLALTQTGTVQGIIAISGYLPDSNNAVVTITAGPSNVGVNATRVDDQYWGWTNLTVGTYTVSYTSCGVPHTGTFTISSNTDVLDQSLSSTAVSTCNSGGSISSNLFYDGAYPTAVELLDSAGTVIASNATGNFSNLPAGTYTTRLSIQPCLIPSAYYYIPGSTVVITNSSTGASIGSAVGVICEDASGNPLTTGSAYIDLNGVAPYTVTYRVQGSGSAYTTINTSSSSIQINNLTANTIYEVNLSDACGTNANTTIQIKTMGNLAASNTAQPCNGSPYTLTIPYYSGATYQWTNPQGAIVSNTRVYAIANYANSYNGTYVCKITWSNCVTRFVNVTLNSALCGGSIGSCGAFDSDGDGVFDLCDLDDDNDGILDSDDCVPQNLILNSTFNSNYTPEWTNTGFWVYNSTGQYAQNTQNNVSAGIGFLTQLVSNIPATTIPLTLTVGARDGSVGGTSDLVIRLGGILYATVKNSTATTNNVTIQLNNGATSNFTAYTVGTSSFVPQTFTIYIPYTGSQSGSLSFEMISGTDDWYVDNISIDVCDKDVDGISNDLDLDSDGDGCFDSLEGDENIILSQLNSIGRINSTVNANGVPILVNSGGAADVGNDVGQGIGQSQDALKNDCLDSDADGFSDWIDLDDDNDGILDTIECSAAIIVENGTFTAPATQWTLGAGWSTAGDIAVNQLDNVTSDLSQNLNNLDRTNGTIKLSFTLGAQDGFNSGGSSANLSVIINGITYATYFNGTVRTIGTNNVTQTLASGVTSTFVPFSTATSSGFTAQKITLTIPYTGPASAPLIFRHNATNLDDWSLDNVSILVNECDADGDNIPNRLDLDSDNDGCLDAIEGGAAITSSQLVTATGTVSVGTGSSASNENLGNTVNANGVPTIAGGGQSVGDSANAAVNSCICYKPAAIDGNTYPAKHGITALGRAGAENDNWPMVRQSAWTVLEAKTKGFVVNRVAFSDADNNPATPDVPTGISATNFVEGMMVYDTTSKCLKVYTSKNGGTSFAWYCMASQACPQ